MELLGKGLPDLEGRDGAGVWGQDFLFAVKADNPPKLSIDKQVPIDMKNVPGTNYWYRLMTLGLGTTHNFEYFVEGKSIGTDDVAGTIRTPIRSPTFPHAKLSAMKTLTSRICPGISANYWVYVNAGVDMTHGAPLVVWQDGENIVGNMDLLRLRLQIMSDNLVYK
jgi:hypothetical protein